MLESTPEAMPPCFETWCLKYDDVFSHRSQRANFRIYLAGLLRESSRKNIFVMAENSVGASYCNLHHFLHDAPWNAEALNNRRIDLIWQSKQTRPAPGFKLIIDDSGHRKSGSATEGVGRQYLGQIGKVDNGMVMVTSHMYDGKRGYPLDFATYKHASSLENGKEDVEFKTKPALAMALIDKCIERDLKPGLVLMDSGYGNNTVFLKSIAEKELKYVASVVSTRKVSLIENGIPVRRRDSLSDIAKNIKPDSFTPLTLKLDKPRTVWVASVEVYVAKLGPQVLAIQLNASKFEDATDVSYFLTNEDKSIAKADWIAASYSERNWIEVFYREVKGWLGITEYQVRDLQSIERHWHLVFNAFTFLSCLRWTGGFQKRYSNKPIRSFGDVFRIFNHVIECLMLKWCSFNLQVLTAHRASRGLVFV